MGKTAENLHDKLPQLTKDRADAYAVRSQERPQPRTPPARSSPTSCRSPSARWTAPCGPGHRRRAAATRHHDGEPRRPQDPLPRASAASPPATPPASTTAPRRPSGGRGGRRRAGPGQRSCAWCPSPSPRRPRDHGLRPGAEHREGPGQGGPGHRRHRPVRDQRGLRRAGAEHAGLLRHRRRRPARQPHGRRHRRRPPAGLLRHPADELPGPRLEDNPGVRYGLTSMCIGLGMGGTVIWENPNYTEGA